MLVIAGELPPGFHGSETSDGWQCPLDAANAAAMRAWQPWCAPQPAGARLSFGLGDRLGLATRGHLRAVGGSGFFPVLAQQSMREMQRAQRSPQAVLDDVTWAVAAENYREGFGSDADHLKTVAEIDQCVDAGFVGFTIDPGAYVDDTAEAASPAELARRHAALPWAALRATPRDNQAYHERAGLPADAYVRASVKYGAAIAHVAALYDHLARRMGAAPFDLEISVDETSSPTSHAQHRYIAAELHRLGVRFSGLAPRFVGDFFKGVDYVGSLQAFEADYAAHAAIAREMGGYKLSLHSGSDKFSIYPLVARHSGSALHVKTSGTSWLEALRVIAQHDPGLFRQIMQLAAEGYAQNRQSYHVSAEPGRIPALGDERLPELLENDDARQTLHVAFGSVLAAQRSAIYGALQARPDAYWQTVSAHIGRHLAALRR